MLYPLAPSSLRPESVDTAAGTALFAAGGAGNARPVLWTERSDASRRRLSCWQYV